MVGLFPLLRGEDLFTAFKQITYGTKNGRRITRSKMH
jgi:hypothetical protein